MPLLKGKSSKVFSHNVSEMMHHGHPQGQALAASYAMKRKKKAHGGDCYAEGGDVEVGVNQESHPKDADKLRRLGLKDIAGSSEAGQMTRAAQSYRENGHNALADVATGMAKDKHKQHLEELRIMPNPKMKAEGGEVECPHCKQKFHHEQDKEEMPREEEEPGIIERIMHKRMSRGGQVANDDSPMADSEDAQFDDLVADDSLEFSDTGANSGDELGDEDDEKRRNDIVARAMMRRAKQRNPNPA